MVLTRTVNAWEVITEWLDTNNGSEKLYETILDFYNSLEEKYNKERLMNSFDFLVCNEFPNGCDLNELIEFFATERDLITKNM